MFLLASKFMKRSAYIRLINYRTSSAFTIVELLVVIVVIGILAAISLVSYTGISKKAIVATITSDLVSASKKFKLFQVENSGYPTGIELNCNTPITSTNICLKSSPNNQYTLTTDNTSANNQSFCLTVKNTVSNVKYHITNDGTPITGSCLISAPTGLTATPTSSNSVSLSWNAVANATSYILQRDTSIAFPAPTEVPTTLANSNVISNGLIVGVTYYYRVGVVVDGDSSLWSNVPSVTTNCSLSLTGFIMVPGSPTYNTNNFCVMKYEAKNVGGVATSQAALSPWTTIDQPTSITTASAVCSGCHLIKEAEWLTIAQNVLGVASNWSGGAVGSGYIYSGHGDNSPVNSLIADINDANGYMNTGNSAGSGANQRRTLTLTNGEVIWDLAGNVWEWTPGTTTTGQPGISGGGYATREWTGLTVHGTSTPDPYPITTGIASSGSWTSVQGIGQIYSNSDETVTHGFLRGGCWNVGAINGVLSLTFGVMPSYASTNVGFRVSR